MQGSGADDGEITAEQLTRLSAMVGLALTAERAEALVPQAEQHFTLMRMLDTIHVGSIEPMVEFRLDRQTSKP